jgi:hypothetical protein
MSLTVLPLCRLMLGKMLKPLGLLGDFRPVCDTRFRRQESAHVLLVVYRWFPTYLGFGLSESSAEYRWL